MIKIAYSSQVVLDAYADPDQAKYNPDSEGAKKYRALHCGMVTLMDEEIGRIISTLKEMDLYDSFVKLVVEFSNTFQTREEALAQRNVIEQWTELDSLYNMFIEKLNAIGKSIPEKRFLKPLIMNCELHDMGR